jgi:hypothetical protein
VLIQPAVRGLVLLRGGLLATVRLSDWRLGWRGEGGRGFVDWNPRSTLEIFDARGVVVRRIRCPGLVIALASDGDRRLAILTEDDRRASRVLWVELDTGRQHSLGMPGAHEA